MQGGNNIITNFLDKTKEEMCKEKKRTEKKENGGKEPDKVMDVCSKRYRKRKDKDSKINTIENRCLHTLKSRFS